MPSDNSRFGRLHARVGLLETEGFQERATMNSSPPTLSPVASIATAGLGCPNGIALGRVLESSKLAENSLLGRAIAGFSGFLAALLLCLPNSARADFEDGWVAYVAGNYNFAYQEWLALAEEGHSGAQLNIGVLHEKGLGVPQDVVKAMQWFERAAEGGESAALHNIGIIYRDGRGVPQDLAEAAKWFLKAAKNGDSHGRLQLGLATIGGLGVPKNVGDGVELIRKAANDNNPSAALELGTMYRQGRHVKQDSGKAVGWYENAAASGSGAAAYALGTMFAEGDGAEVDPIRAYAWFWVAARRGHSVADLAGRIVAESLQESELKTAEELGMALIQGRRYEDVRLLMSRN